MKIKINKVGQPCRHCGYPVVEARHGPGFAPKGKQSYYFQRWFKCLKCKTVYMDDTSRVEVKRPDNDLFTSN
jgi:hypothetical protein